MYFQRMSSRDGVAELEEAEHEHCKNCIKYNCNVRPNPPDSCHMITCQLGCGLRFHSCKLDEHQHLCPSHKVQCVNFTNGCPIILPRSDLGPHLERCPASVVQCTMEWNRWPVYSKERQSRVPFVHDNIHARYGQLDVALALRDQRMLNEAMKAPRATRRALRNHLTQRFPAVPLCSPRKGLEYDIHTSQSNDTSRTVSDDDSDAPWETAKDPPGLQRSVCSELFRSTKKLSENVKAATYGMPGKTESTSKLHDIVEHMEHTLSEKNDRGNQNDASTDKTQNESEDEVVMKEENQESDIDANMNRPRDLIGLRKTGDKMETGLSKVNLENDDYMRIKFKIRFTDDKPNDIENKCRPPKMIIPDPPAPPPLMLKQILGLDLNLESITRYQAKPKSMYTFLCSQEFRRDEYAWHFKNVHNDIHGGLNGWLEQRCPLAHYGCTFSIRRFHPKQKGDQVVFSNILESFGVKPKVPGYHASQSHEGLQERIIEKIETQCEENGRIQRAISHESTPEIFTSKDYNSAIKVNGNPSMVIQKADGTENSHQPITSHRTSPAANQDPCPNKIETEPEDADQPMKSLETSPVANQDPCPNKIETGDSDCTPPDLLTSLPFEVIQHIAQCLDSYSMCNLALTSKILRDVCCSLLEQKGIVIQQWQREQVGGRIHWYISFKVCISL